MTARVLLAIETATEMCSAALLVGDRLLERSELAPRRHAELILPMIESLLEESGLRRSNIDGIAVGRGPGAFTGVRLAISVAQGLALGLDIPVITVSSLAALAFDALLAAGESSAPILAVIDARMGEIYAGWYRRNGEGAVELVGVESVGAARDVGALWLATKLPLVWNVVGSGWATYAPEISASLSSTPAFADGARYPQARAIARLARAQFERGAGLLPEAALPVYLRDKVALTMQEQRAR